MPDRNSMERSYLTLIVVVIVILVVLGFIGRALLS